MNILYIIFNKDIGGNLLQISSDDFSASCQFLKLCFEWIWLQIHYYFYYSLTLICFNLGIWKNCTLGFRRQVLQLTYPQCQPLTLDCYFHLDGYILFCLGGLGLMDPAFFFFNLVPYFKIIHSLLNEQLCLMSRLVLFKLQNASKSPEGFIKTQISGYHPRVSDIWGFCSKVIVLLPVRTAL